MQHYINPATGEVYAFAADGSQDEYRPPGLEPISDEALAARRAAEADPAAPILQAIAALEAQMTPRRLREALLSGDLSFIESIEQQIADQRAQLPS